MAKKIALVGHCGPDSSYLRMTVQKAGKDVQIVSADDDRELSRVLADGVDLILFNRELGYGFTHPMGVDAIRHLRAMSPGLKMMLVSNYADAQAAAVAAGALPGFGKREIGSPRVVEVLRAALDAAEASAAVPEAGVQKR
jgi:two-component system, chemotaxis family, chemotaxis protein CheY